MDWILEPQLWIAFFTLVALELVLGVDNVIFISILAGKLPTAIQQRARVIGLSLAVVSRLLLLLSLSWIIRLTEPLFSVLSFNVSGRDIILIIGGLFLIGKATHEIHDKLEGEEGHASARATATFSSFLVQVFLLDMVFSLDSVITAVGMVDRIEIMTAAVVIAAGVMIFSSGALSTFVERHPTIKMLALAFLLLIGFVVYINREVGIASTYADILMWPILQSTSGKNQITVIIAIAHTHPAATIIKEQIVSKSVNTAGIKIR